MARVSTHRACPTAGSDDERVLLLTCVPPLMSASLSYFHDIGSLSRASALSSDAARQVAALEKELAAAEAEVPNVLSWVRSEAADALTHLDVADAQCTAFEGTVASRLRETSRLTSRRILSDSCLT